MPCMHQAHPLFISSMLAPALPCSHCKCSPRTACLYCSGRHGGDTWGSADQAVHPSAKRTAPQTATNDSRKRVKPNDPELAAATLAGLAAYGSDNDDDNEAAPMNTDPSEDCILLESIEASVPQSAALIAARAALKPDAAASAPPEAAQQPPAAAAEQSKAAAAEAAQQPPQAAAPAQQTPQHRGRGGRGRRGGRERQPRGPGRGPGRSFQQNQAPVRGSPPTLLQKLLAKDIHTERSHLLQCLRFLVSNNFLLHADHAPVVYPSEPAPLPPEFDLTPMTEDIALDEEEGSEDFTDGENEAAQLMQPAQDSGLVAVA